MIKYQEMLESATVDFWLTRFLFQRSLAFIYLLGFLIAANQFPALAGERGLLPSQLFVQRVSFWDAPSLFFFHCSDRVFISAASLGVVLSLIALFGFSDSYGMLFSVATWSLLWVLYLSFVNIGQVFYGFGWETLLLETGFLAIFLGSKNVAPPQVVIWLLRWVLFRVMFGAGMIKLRADPCWKDLTCMYYYYETQPLPNPLSWYFHYLPRFIHKASVVFNHFVELIVPWGIFAPRPICYFAGGFTILFQLILILSGNLSWLNYITIVLCIPCFDDAVLSRILTMDIPAVAPPSFSYKIVLGMLSLLIVVLSLKPARNLFSRRQLMNASFEPFHLVNTYGAFGSVTRERMEILIQGTNDQIVSDSTDWRDYELKGKPGDVNRRPCLVSPYHYKLDWQMWFAAMSGYARHPWFLNLVGKLLEGDKAILKLLANNPFPEKPPRFIRAELYQYHFTEPGDEPRHRWTRARVGEYLVPLSLDNPSFRDLRKRMGWISH